MHKSFAALLFLFGAFCARGQSWEAVRALAVGDHVRVRDTAGVEVKGTLNEAPSDRLSIGGAKGLVSIDRSRVSRVEVRSAARRGRNALIGAAVGVAIGITVDRTLGVRLRNEGADSGRALTYAAPIALLGAMGALMPGYRTVYRVK